MHDGRDTPVWIDGGKERRGVSVALFEREFDPCLERGGETMIQFCEDSRYGGRAGIGDMVEGESHDWGG